MANAWRAPDDYLAVMLSWDWHFCPLADTKHEIWSIDADSTVVLLANRFDRTNILFKYDRSDDD